MSAWSPKPVLALSQFWGTLTAACTAEAAAGRRVAPSARAGGAAAGTPGPQQLAGSTQTCSLAVRCLPPAAHSRRFPAHRCGRPGVCTKGRRWAGRPCLWCPSGRTGSAGRSWSCTHRERPGCLHQRTPARQHAAQARERGAPDGLAARSREVDDAAVAAGLRPEPAGAQRGSGPHGSAQGMAGQPAPAAASRPSQALARRGEARRPPANGSRPPQRSPTPEL